MLNKLLGDFINGAISAHTSQIKNQDISLKLLQNSIYISKLELYKFAFFQYGFPIVIKCGFIKNIEIVVPWATFQFDEVKVIIDDIFILASFPSNDPTKFVSDQDLYDIKEHQLAAHHEFTKRFYKIIKQISSQKLFQIAKRVLHSCSIEIKNIHVRIEIDNKTNCHAFGIIASSINILTKKPSKGIPRKIEKNIDINNLSVYLDLNQPLIKYSSIDDFLSIMKNMSKSGNHSFLLEPSFISAKMTSSTEDELSNIEIVTDLNDIVFSISKEQLSIMIEMAANIKKFNQFMFLKKAKKILSRFMTNTSLHKSTTINDSNNDDKNQQSVTINKGNHNACNNNTNNETQNANSNVNIENKQIENIDQNIEFDNYLNWMFFHILAKMKNNSLLDSALDRILYRNRYVKEWNKLIKKSERTPLLIELDHKLDYQAILYFRALAEATKVHVLKVNYNEILRFVEYDPLLFIPSFLSCFSILASATMVKIKMLNLDNKIDYQTMIKSLSLNFGQKHIHIGLDTFDIVFNEGENQFNVFKSISPLKNNISIDAKFQSFTKGSIKIVSEPMKFGIDLSRMFNFFMNLGLGISFDSFEKLKSERIYYQIDVDLKEIHLLTFYQKNVIFDFGIDSFSAHQNPLNLKEYFVLIKNISFSHNSVYILKNLNIKSKTFHGIMNVEIPKFKVNLMKNDFEKLNELKQFVQKAYPLSQLNSFSLKNVRIELEGIDISSDLLNKSIVLGKSTIIYLDDLYKNEFEMNFSKIEINYIVVENIEFKLLKEPNLIQSTASINQFYIKDLDICIQNAVPFMKGIYNHIKETMDIYLAIDSIKLNDFKVVENIKSFVNDIISLTTTFDETNNNENNNENSFLKYLYKLVGTTELKLPQIKLTIHYVSRPIAFVYNNLNIFVNLEWSLLFNPFVFTLSIPSLKIIYNKDKYLEIKNFTFIYHQKSEISISALQVDLNLTEKIIEEIKNQYTKLLPIMKKLLKLLKNTTKLIPNIKINIQTISFQFLKLMNKYNIKLPFSQLNIGINKTKAVNLTTIAMLNFPDIGLKTEPMNILMNYCSNKDNKTIDLQIINQLKIIFLPLKLQKFIASKNIFYVNQTGIELHLIVDEKEITIPNDASYIASHFPNDPKICFPNGKKCTYLDISRLWAEQSIATSYGSGMILVWKTQSLLFFSSPIEIINTTGETIQLLDPYFNNAIIPNNQTFYVSPNIESQVKTLSLFFIETNFKIRARLLENSYTIHEKNSYFRFITERNITSLVARVTVTAIVFIRSCYPETLLVEFNFKSEPKKFVLYPLIKVPLNVFDINTTKITFKLSSNSPNGYFSDNCYTVNIPLSVGESTISFSDSKHNKQTFYLRYRVTEENIKNTLIKTVELAAPIFIVNQLGISVVFSLTDKDKKFLSNFNSQYTPKNNNMFRQLTHRPVFKNAITPYCYVKDDEVSFYLSYPLTMKYTKDKFGVSRINSKELALIPTSQNDDKIMPVTFHVTHDETITPTIYLRPYVILHNNTNQTIHIDENSLEKNNYLIVRSVSPLMETVISTSDIRIPINLENISNFSISGLSFHYKIQFSVSFIDEIKYITISTVNSLGLYAIINETDKDFIVNQVSMKMNQYFVLSQSSLLFDLSDTRTECSIECCAPNIPPFVIQLDRPKDLAPIPGIDDDIDEMYYSVEIVGNNRYVAHLYQKSPVLSNENNSSMNFLVSAQSMSLKIIGKKYQEYCNISFGSISFHILHQDMKESIALSIASIQIDDMNEYANHPVVLFSVKKPFFNLGLLKTLNSSYFDYLVCSITPVQAEIDISFINDMISLLNLKFSQEENEIFAKTEKKAKFNCINLKISPIDTNLSIYTRTFRQYRRFETQALIPRFLSFVPTIENFHFKLNPINASDLRCSQKEFFLILLDNAQLSFSTLWLRLIRSAAVIGKPQTLISNFANTYQKPTSKQSNSSNSTEIKNESSVNSHNDDNDNDKDYSNSSASHNFMSLFSGIAKVSTGLVPKKNTDEYFQIASIIFNSIGKRKRVEEPKKKTHYNELEDSSSLNVIFFSYEADISEDYVFVGDTRIDISDISWVKKVEFSKIVKIETISDSKQVAIEFKKEKTANQFHLILQLQIERKLTQKIFMIPYLKE